MAGRQLPYAAMQGARRRHVEAGEGFGQRVAGEREIDAGMLAQSGDLGGEREAAIGQGGVDRPPCCLLSRTSRRLSATTSARRWRERLGRMPPCAGWLP